MPDANLLQEALKNGASVIDNTKDEAYYRDQRLQQNAEKLAKHVFVENLEVGQRKFDLETSSIRRRISFDFVDFLSEVHLDELHDQVDIVQKYVAEQLLKAVSAP